MCGRFWIDPETSEAELQRIIDILNRKQSESSSPGQIKTGEICPTDVAPVIANSRARTIKPFLMQWGFSGIGTNARPVINARSETALEKSMFREPLLERRCLIPASHYFEWQAQGQSKIKHALKTVEPMIYMVGIYRFEPNQSLPVFSILTKEAAPDIQHIHTRMPFIIPREHCHEWLSPNADVRELLEIADNRLVYGAVV